MDAHRISAQKITGPSCTPVPHSFPWRAFPPFLPPSRVLIRVHVHVLSRLALPPRRPLPPPHARRNGRRFDDAYFLEPEAAKSGGKVCATGAPKSVAVPAGRGGGGEAASSEAAVDSGAKTMREEEGGDGGGVFAKPTATAEVIMPEAPVDCTDDGGRGGGKGCAPALGEEVSSEDAARAKEKGGACPKGERNGAGRGDGGAVVRPTDDAAAAPREEGHGAGGAESNVTGVAEGGHNQNACAEPGADQPVGTDGTLGGVAVKGSRPPAVWASSKRPRTEEARAAAL